MSNYTINAAEVEIGKNVEIEDGVYIGGKFGTKTKKVKIGDGVVIGKNSRFYYPHFEIGDYTVINNSAFGSGDNECLIGSCCWFGQNCVFDSEGGLEIHNGVGAGAYSQMWSHILFGDTLQGCNFDSRKRLIIEDDVWLVGHVVISPVTAKKKSMAMVGSVVTKDMEENHIYAGCPAKDISDKIGFQYKDVNVEEKFKKLSEKMNEFFNMNSQYNNNKDLIKIITDDSDIKDDKISYFNVKDRTYTKRLSPVEYGFMKFLLVRTKFYHKGIKQD